MFTRHRKVVGEAQCHRRLRVNSAVVQKVHSGTLSSHPALLEYMETFLGKGCGTNRGSLRLSSSTSEAPNGWLISTARCEGHTSCTVPRRIAGWSSAPRDRKHRLSSPATRRVSCPRSFRTDTARIQQGSPNFCGNDGMRWRNTMRSAFRRRLDRFRTGALKGLGVRPQP